MGGKGGTTTQVRSSSGKALASLATLFCVALLILLPSPAYAQIDVGDAVDEATDTVDETTDTVEDTVDETVDETTDTVEDTVDDVVGTVQDSTDEDGPVQDTVDQVTETVDKVTGGATKPVTDVVRDTTRPTLKKVDDALGDTVDGVVGARTPRFSRGRTNGTVKGRRVTTPDRVKAGRTFNGTAADAAGSGDIVGNAAGAIPDAPTAEAQPAEAGGFLGQAERIARALAFPMILLVLVAGFLVVQGRLDRDDPKLSLAPLDVDEEYLSFR